MPAPVYSDGTYGSVTSGSVAVAAGKNTAAFVTVATDVEANLTCEMWSGATAPNAATTFSLYRAYACSATTPFAPITVSGTASSGATSIGVSSATGLHAGQLIVVQQADGSKLGEAVQITSISGTTLTVPAITNSYAASDLVFLIQQTAVSVATPTPLNGVILANDDNSSNIATGPGRYCIVAANAATNTGVTVAVTDDLVTMFS